MTICARCNLMVPEPDERVAGFNDAICKCDPPNAIPLPGAITRNRRVRSVSVSSIMFWLLYLMSVLAIAITAVAIIDKRRHTEWLDVTLDVLLSQLVCSYGIFMLVYVRAALKSPELLRSVRYTFHKNCSCQK